MGKPNEDIVKTLVDGGLTREELLSSLKSVMIVAFKKLGYANTTAQDKMGWSRIIVSAIAVGTPLLRDSELAELKSEVQELKHLIESR